MEIPKDCRYTKEHEWVRVEKADSAAAGAGQSVRIGITEYAQSALGDIVFVELPKVGQKLAQMQPFGSVEAVKTVSDLFSPVTGEVLEINAAIEDDPTLVNRSPHKDGWMIRASISNPKELDSLLSPEEYGKLAAELEAGH